ncbi:large conductance mechanosensitive channel protein MscL [Yimella sp. cx-51]|uniref:large conductance mechanosensitive channel protein MscL n=1 Tax=Yimella sp. cx-51 TaxID=2770551 RepID=UPI00165D7B3C|nr:large conductance mechanosensitive channel protein MscL [Yimella sp. cx-51]MBC9956215.1 large conductance mechanosensitive channel protein MscL [Yimella sp. cx-51]QTH38638.1 large conductance mechanosensitive channel protein MscL [Yimella sp. cx-51]
MKGFKEFLFQGNVLELAVAVVIGSAFAKVVESFVSAIITPVVNAAGGKTSEGLGFRLVSDQKNTFINFSTIINALIVFVITAAVVYFVFVLPAKKLQERRKSGVEIAADPTELDLLAEIRDELRARR